MATIETRVGRDGRTTYRARVRVHGKAPLTATFDRKTDAKQWAARTESDLRRGRYVPTNEALRRTVADLLDRYVTEHLPAKAHRKDAANMVRRLTWWRESLGGLPLAELTPAVVADGKARLLARHTRTGTRFSGGSVNRYLAALSAALKAACQEWHWLEANPVANVSRQAESRGRVRFLSGDERGRLLAACRASSSPALYPVVLLALSAGFRKAEVLGLRWSDVDLARGIATARDTKNGETRSVAIRGPALDTLREWAKVRRLDSVFVFPSPRRADRPTGIEESWRAAIQAAGITDFRFHDLRHTCASYLAMNGATLAEIAAVLGHKTLAMVKRYAHISEQHSAAVLERMTRNVFG